MVDAILEDVGFTVDTWAVVANDNDEVVALELADAVMDDVSLTWAPRPPKMPPNPPSPDDPVDDKPGNWPFYRCKCQVQACNSYQTLHLPGMDKQN